MIVAESPCVSRIRFASGPRSNSERGDPGIGWILFCGAAHMERAYGQFCTMNVEDVEVLMDPDTPVKVRV